MPLDPNVLMSDQEFYALKPWFEQQDPALVDEFRQQGQAEHGWNPTQSGKAMYVTLKDSAPVKSTEQPPMDAATPPPSQGTPQAPVQEPQQDLDMAKYQGLIDKLGAPQSGADVFGSALAGAAAGLGATRSAVATGQNASTAALNASKAVGQRGEKDQAKALELMLAMRGEQRATSKEQREVEKFDLENTMVKEKADPGSEISRRFAETVNKLVPNIDATGLAYNEIEKALGPAAKMIGYQLQADILRNTMRHQGVMEGQAAAGLGLQAQGLNQRAINEQNRGMRVRRKELETIIESAVPGSPEATRAQQELQTLGTDTGAGGGIEDLYLDPTSGQEVSTPGSSFVPDEDPGVTTAQIQEEIRARAAGEPKEEGPVDFDGVSDKGMQELLAASQKKDTEKGATPIPEAAPVTPEPIPALSLKSQKKLAEETAIEQAKAKVKTQTEIEEQRRGFAALQPQYERLEALLKKGSVSGIPEKYLTENWPTIARLTLNTPEAQTIIDSILVAEAKTFGAAPSEGERLAIKSSIFDIGVDEDLNINTIKEKVRGMMTKLYGDKPTGGASPTIKYGPDGRKYEVDPATKRVLREIP